MTLIMAIAVFAILVINMIGGDNTNMLLVVCPINKLTNFDITYH